VAREHNLNRKGRKG